MIKAILFDVGGTLHVSTPQPGRPERFAARLIERLGDYGIRLDTTPEALAATLARTTEEYKHYSEQTLREYPTTEIWCDWFLKDFHLDPEKIAPIAEELSFLYDYERPRVMRREHMTQTLKLLKAQGYRLGIISNIISKSVMPHFLMEYGIDDLMDCVVLSSTTGIRKPSAEIYRAAEKALGLRPEELAFVGDTISRDVIGTRNAGWRLMIRITNPGTAFRDAGLEDAAKPDYTIKDLSEIPDILARENMKEA